jgi:hypothetical protein
MFSLSRTKERYIHKTIFFKKKIFHKIYQLNKHLLPLSSEQNKSLTLNYRVHFIIVCVYLVLNYQYADLVKKTINTQESPTKNTT